MRVNVCCWLCTQGMLNAVAEVVSNSQTLMSLWKHECLRVFADRFTTQEDKDWFEKAIKQVSDSALYFCGFLLTSDLFDSHTRYMAPWQCTGSAETLQRLTNNYCLIHMHCECEDRVK